jgi:nucleoside-diphosphate-sugar epimerase
MKILITGADGFLGQQLTEIFLTRGDQVINPRGLNPDFDVTNKENVESLEQEDFDCVLHLAAKTAIDLSFKNPGLFYSVNVGGTLNMLELARKKKVNFVFPSSAAVYGPIESLPVSENMEPRPVSPYGMSKFIAENLAKSYAQSFNLQVVVIRLFNTYGSGHNPNFIIPKIIKGVNEGKIEFKYGTSSKRDFVYIKDVLSAFVKSVDFDKFSDVPFEVFNVGTGNSRSIQEVYEIICSLTNLNPVTIVHESKQKGGVDDSRADVAKAKVLLGWESKYSLEDGLKEMLK